MIETRYHKLVRDKIPELIIKSGRIPKYDVLKGDEILVGISSKFTEELLELKQAKTHEHRVEELADVYEVFLALKEYYDIDWKELEKKVAKKKIEKGSFSKNYILYSVEEII